MFVIFECVQMSVLQTGRAPFGGHLHGKATVNVMEIVAFCVRNSTPSYVFNHFTAVILSRPYCPNMIRNSEELELLTM